MFEICQDVIFVQGAKNGAIYDLNSRKVFWVNDEACNLIMKITTKVNNLNEEEKEYISQLIKENLYSPDFISKEYIPHVDNTISLELAWLEITQACNAKCLHCYQGNYHDNSKNVLTIDKWKKVISELEMKSVKRVVVIGGEPCIHKDIEEILQCLCTNQINTTLFTNGTLFNKELIQFVIKNSNFIKVKVSLYGHNAEIHDKITTVRGSFDKLINSIIILKSNNVEVDIAVVAMKENQDYLEDIRDFVNHLGLKYSGYDVIRNVFGGTQDQHTPNKKEVLEKSKFSKPVFYTSKEQFLHSYSRNTCWYGKIAITETGDVLPCVFERNISYGNVLEESIDEILNSINLKSNWFKDFSFINDCKDCEFRFACKDCRPLGISVCGNIHEKNPRCLYNPHTGEWSNKNGTTK